MIEVRTTTRETRHYTAAVTDRQKFKAEREVRPDGAGMLHISQESWDSIAGTTHRDILSLSQRELKALFDLLDTALADWT